VDCVGENTLEISAAAEEEITKSGENLLVSVRPAEDEVAEGTSLPDIA
jgi:hypothetical protein